MKQTTFFLIGIAALTFLLFQWLKPKPQIINTKEEKKQIVRTKKEIERNQFNTDSVLKHNQIKIDRQISKRQISKQRAMAIKTKKTQIVSKVQHELLPNTITNNTSCDSLKETVGVLLMLMNEYDSLMQQQVIDGDSIVAYQLQQIEILQTDRVALQETTDSLLEQNERLLTVIQKQNRKNRIRTIFNKIGVGVAAVASAIVVYEIKK